MRLLVLQHIAVEHPGILRDYLRRRDGVFNRNARRLHDNFLTLVRAARGPNQGDGTRSATVSG